ncbi:MAG: zinc-dependent peptidase [Bacteroidetes bacterium]|nr:zinc-dependent peptidase [Bacteroidota bacterium]
MEGLIVIILVVVGGVWVSANSSSRRRNANFAQLAIKLGSYKLSPHQIELLNDFVPYYKGLPVQLKPKFESRLAYFIKIKDFAGADGISPTLEMQTLIGAVAIKLTMGFKEFMLPHFHTIFIYPKEYYSEDTGFYHQGEVNLKGHIKLSWNHFSTGIANATDGLNLAVHEFAHAVYFENQIPNSHYHFMPPAKLRAWKVLAEREMEQMELNENHFIRDYGATNISEFFAVSTEHFFEQPHEFRDKHAELYKAMVHLFKQDPRRYV